jgi:sulfur carrier protein ThiS
VHYSFDLFIHSQRSTFINFGDFSQKELKKIKQLIEDETPLTVEESRALKKKHDDLEFHFDGIIAAKEREIDDRNSLISKRDETIARHENTIKEFQKRELSDSLNGSSERMAILKEISKNDEMTIDDLVKKVGINRERIMYEAGELKEQGFISSINKTEEPPKFRIEQRGRRKLFEPEFNLT